MDINTTINQDSSLNKILTQEELIEQYINSLNTIERQALNIAKNQLETSFNISKSIGYLEFVKNLKSVI